MFVCAVCGQPYPTAGYCAADGAPLEAADDPLLGTEIDRYRIARTLGEGGMGKVYLAVQPAIGSRVAIKLLSDQCANTPELVERFFAEARAVNLIRHEHIVGVLDMARLPDGRPFIVMEFVEGQTLAEVVRASVAPLGGVLQVMGEVLAALGAAHAIGIVHRDLKPDNILVTAEGHAKVLDFGIAKLAPNLREVGSATRTGALLGTPAYMAPEQISGSANVDGRTDIYAAGCVLFEAVTGQPPFHGGTMFDLMRAHVEQPPPSPRAMRPDLPPAIEHIIFTALDKDPARRFQSAGAMAQALAHAGGELGADQWRALSRNAVLTPRISAGGIVSQPTPRGTPPRVLGQQGTPTVERRSHAIAPTQDSRRRNRALLYAAIGALIVAGAIALIVATHGGGKVVDDRSVAAAAGSAIARPPVPVVTPPLVTESAPAPSPGGSPTVPTMPAPTHPKSPASGPRSPASGPQSPASGPPSADQIADAAKHNVIIGPNVHLGPNVVIGGSPATPSLPGQNSLTKPVDYDPKHFDPVAYVGTAEAFAQELLPDAKLTRFEFDPVWSDGHVDLTTPGRDREYEFRSVAASARPADVPKNVEAERGCIVHVEVSPRGVTAEIRKRSKCDERLVRHPSCHLPGVWKQALAAGVGRDVVARIAWLSDEKWFFDTDLGGEGGGTTTSFPDACH
ncbi:MAG TPA: protein kinase [Kofleriaceae bacterium]